jgi:hypothetical protein
MNARQFSKKYGFSESWLATVLKRHKEEVEKKLIPNVLEKVQKGKRFYWVIKDEEALKRWLQEKGYKLS